MSWPSGRRWLGARFPLGTGMLLLLMIHVDVFVVVTRVSFTVFNIKLSIVALHSLMKIML